jgi:DNA-binding CsgD family transcriptional regulator
VRQDAHVAESTGRVTVVVGVDGSGRTRRLAQLASAVAGAGGTVVRVDPAVVDDGQLASLLDGARVAGTVVVVDDAHRLGAPQLRLLAGAARTGAAILIARRPTIDGAELADLDEAVAGLGAVEVLHPLGAEGMAALVAEVTGAAPSADTVAALLAASAGLPLVAVALAANPAQPSAALVARVQRRLAALDPGTAGLAEVLALELELTDDVLAAAAELDRSRLAASMRTLRDEGFLVPDGERMIPAVAHVVMSDLPPAQRRRVHEAVARALLAAGATALVAAAQLRAARAWTPTAARVYRAAGDQLRYADPAAAVSWYDDAANAGAEAPALAAGRAEAAALLGLPVDVEPTGVPPPDAARLALVHGAVAAHQGRAARSAAALAAAPPPGPLLAVPALVVTGQLEAARAAAGAGPLALSRLAEAALAMVDPPRALPLLIEAAEEMERVPPELVLPDTPHALGALLAAASGDAATAEHLLQRASAVRAGGPVAVERHRLLLAWVRMRAGRYDTAVAELRRLAETGLDGRDRLLYAALAAGIARRSGDIAKLREAWAGVEQALARAVVDLSVVEQVEELAVAAARIRRHQRAAPTMEALDEIVRRLGSPPGWTVAVKWIRLQVAVALEDAPAAAVVATEIGAVTTMDGRAGAQRAAASLWAQALAGEVDPDAVAAACDGLAAVELPWEASRLAGQAAIRTSDPSAARRLLERARDLSSAEVATGDGRSETAAGGLSEREIEVARMVLDGATYREIGGRLFISPKTVEHHVARIRTKLGANSRAEFVAAIREVLGETGL